MDTKTILNEATGRMQKAIDHLEEELLNVRAGKASPNALNGVMVDYFGSQVPVSGAASVTVPDARTILIQPWDKNMLRPIEKAIIDSNIGLTPSNNGEQIAELGKVDAGGGGTVAMYMANRNITTLDAGVPVLAMHAPFEVVSKLDCYETYKGMKAVYEAE